MDKSETRYDIDTEVMFAPGAHMDVTAIAAATSPGGTARSPPSTTPSSAWACWTAISLAQARRRGRVLLRRGGPPRYRAGGPHGQPRAGAGRHHPGRGHAPAARPWPHRRADGREGRRRPDGGLGPEHRPAVDHGPQHLALQAPPVEGRVLRLEISLSASISSGALRLQSTRSAGAPLARRPCGRPSRSAGAEVTVRIRSISGMRPSWWKVSSAGSRVCRPMAPARPRHRAGACPRPAPGRGRTQPPGSTRGHRLDHRLPSSSPRRGGSTLQKVR